MINKKFRHSKEKRKKVRINEQKAMSKSKEIIVIKSERNRETCIEFLNRTQDREEHNIKQSVPSDFSTL